MASSSIDFPRYTSAERLADGVVHCLGLVSATLGIVWLLSRWGSQTSIREIASTLVYGFGLIGMLSASALYNFSTPGRPKAVFRMLDHSMIFVMIAGTYTPFTLIALPPALGVPLCSVVWAVAAHGIGLKLMFPGRYELLLLILYLGLGWLGLGVVPSLWSVLPGNILLLLLIGGIIYSLGALLHTCGRVSFHNALWHAMVVAAAGFHLAAVAQLLPAAE